MPILYINEYVVRRTRKGRRKPELTCRCDALSFPHRAGSDPQCIGLLYCEHGLPLYGHPDYEGRCPECDRWEAADIAFDRWRDDRLC